MILLCLALIILTDNDDSADHRTIITFHNFTGEIVREQNVRKHILAIFLSSLFQKNAKYSFLIVFV